MPLVVIDKTADESTVDLFLSRDVGDLALMKKIRRLRAQVFLVGDAYERDTRWSAKTVSAAEDRHKLLSPNKMAVIIDQSLFVLTDQIELDLSSAASWDTTAGTDYTDAANRAGNDFYIYACDDDNTLKFRVSANSTYPSGYTAETSRKIGGFHCLCVDVDHATTLTAWAADTEIALNETRRNVGTFDGCMYRCVARAGDFKTHATTEPDWSSIAVGETIVDDQITWTKEVHALEGYVAGDILPASVWDLKHRPVSSPEGMVYVEGVGKWVDIYLASVSGGELVSSFGGTIADGASTPAFHWYKFAEWFSRIGKTLPSQPDFFALSAGSNQGTNIYGSADPVTVKGSVDTSGRRMISDVGCESCCGAMWQCGCDPGGGASAASWVDAFDANDSGVAGQHYLAPNRALVGGHWNYGTYCGSRGSTWSHSPLYLSSTVGARGVSSPRASE
jgi:hypothetical protein